MEINNTYTCNPTNYRTNRTKAIEYIVIHYVGAEGDAEANAKYYSDTAGIGASAHYFVGHASENGAIYQSVPEECCAWHCGSETGVYYHDCRNDSSIGVEMCCHLKNNNWYFDEITVENTVKLVKMLMAKYGIPAENVIRHYDVTHKRCPAPFVNDEALWNDFKLKILKPAELCNIEDIVSDYYHRGIITDRELWLKKLEEDKNAYWLARKTINYIRGLESDTKQSYRDC